jgi:hypothetical protein
MNSADNAIHISAKFAAACEEQPSEDILAAIAILLAFLVKENNPKDGMYLLMQVVSRASELAFDVSAEIITQDHLQ